MTLIAHRNYPASLAAQLEQQGIIPLLARIYAARGIKQAKELDTALSQLLPITGLKNVQQMACLLADAIAAQKKLLIVADYDADGATACAVAMRGLKAMGAKVDYVVPNRFEYGYGLTPEIVQLAAHSSPDIIITVDNGIASVEGVAEARRLGIDVMVTDHHLPGDTLPDALCIVNPNQPGCAFPSKHLAGVGVMFYVLMALRAELRNRNTYADKPEPNLGKLLDLVALGTVADVVKLDANNRIFVEQGLQRIRAGRACAGINALLQVAKKSPAKATTYELGFMVGPRLNAAGRLEDMNLGIQCLLSDNPAEALQIASRLDALNQERRSIEAEMQDVALGLLDDVNPQESYSLVLHDETWHQGVIGILASRLKDKFHRPVIAFARADAVDDSGKGELKGSGRSITGLHLRDALDLVSKRHPQLIRKFGGHAMAAGLTIAEPDLAHFQQAFESVAQELLNPADLTRIIETDGTLQMQEYSFELAYQLERQVWGQGFPQPLFDGEFKVVNQRIVGEKHLKLALSNAAGQFDAIHFFNTDTAPARIRAVYSLGINEYNGQASLQLLVRHREAA